jgi:hypothetical protein
MATPCSVNTYGRYRRPPRPAFEVTNCDLKAAASSVHDLLITNKQDLPFNLLRRDADLSIRHSPAAARRLMSTDSASCASYSRVQVRLHDTSDATDACETGEFRGAAAITAVEVAQRFHYNIDPNFVAVLEAIRDRLCR